MSFLRTIYLPDISRKKGGMAMSAILNNVYNHYMTSYAPRSVTKYDTHKKSELRSIYHSIVKLNKESPWYLPTTSKKTHGYAIDIKENARILRNTIASLGGLEESGMLNKKTAYSSDEDVASAHFIGNYTPGGAIPAFRLEVMSLASPQVNLGDYMSNTRSELTPDTYSFDIAINDMNYEFQFDIGENDTNTDIQERLARLINNASIGLNATLEESGGETALKLTSEATGIAPGRPYLFTVSDQHTSQASGAVAYFGLDYISRHPSNAVFLVNGEERSAASNHFNVGKLFEVQLHGVSPEGSPVNIGLKTDVDSLTDNVVHLIQGYNHFVKAAAAYQEQQPRSRRLIHEMSGIASLYQNNMQSAGLDLLEDGELKVDKELLSQTASETEDISETFGFLKDFSNMLLRKTSQVSLNPMDYVERTMVAYKNPGHNFANPYMTSAYSGMMFNSYC